MTTITTGVHWDTIPGDGHAEPIGPVSATAWPWDQAETLHYLQRTRSRGGTWEGLHWWKDDENGARSHLLICNETALPVEGDHE